MQKCRLEKLATLWLIGCVVLGGATLSLYGNPSAMLKPMFSTECVISLAVNTYAAIVSSRLTIIQLISSDETSQNRSPHQRKEFG